MPSEDVGGIGRRLFWSVEKIHMGFFESASAFVVVAGRAGRYNIRPCMRAAQMSGDYMIYRQASITPTAILTGIIVTAKDFAARELDTRARAMNLHIQAND